MGKILILSVTDHEEHILNKIMETIANEPKLNHIEMCIRDSNMPGMDGLTVCQKIREHIACPILFLTARIESSDKIIGFQAGADD